MEPLTSLQNKNHVSGRKGSKHQSISHIQEIINYSYTQNSIPNPFPSIQCTIPNAIPFNSHQTTHYIKTSREIIYKRAATNPRPIKAPTLTELAPPVTGT
jgi:hypothetical protein